MRSNGRVGLLHCEPRGFITVDPVSEENCHKVSLPGVMLLGADHQDGILHCTLHPMCQYIYSIQWDLIMVH